MKKYKVYQIVNTINGHNYIGYTQLDLIKRLRLHTSSKSKSMPIVNAIKKYGNENFIITLLFDFDSKQEAINKEIELIEQVKPYYNIHSGGTGGPMFGPMNGMFGKKHSDQWKQNKKQQMLGEKNPMYGKSHSIQTKQILSKIKLGSEPWNKGKTGVYSEETIDKMKKPKTQKHKDKIKKQYTFISPEGNNVTVVGLTEFCLQYNLNKGAMSEVWNGKRKTHKGWKK
jgi:group I intron endonuclease